LHIPAGAPYRAIAAALAGKFAEFAGYAPPEAARLGEAIARAAAEVAAGAGAAGGLDVEFSRRDGRVEITVSSGAQAVRVARPSPR
jgi:hypothetical protein